MEIQHTDKQGKSWQFSLACTTYQRDMLTRLLLAIRNLGNVEKLQLCWYENAENNDAFCSRIEAALLAGLSLISHEQNNTGAVENKTAKPQQEESESRKPYYWENF